MCLMPPWRAQGQLLLTVNTGPLHHKDELLNTVRDGSRWLSEIHIEQINTRRKQSVELFNMKAGDTYGNHSSARNGGKQLRKQFLCAQVLIRFEKKQCTAVKAVSCKIQQLKNPESKSNVFKSVTLLVGKVIGERLDAGEADRDSTMPPTLSYTFISPYCVLSHVRYIGQQMLLITNLKVQ